MPMESRVVSTASLDLLEHALEEATRLLKAGELVAIPTETVYGLAGNALDPASVEKIYQVKGRPKRNPLIVHVSGIRMAKECSRSWPDSAAKLAHAFWPGPLTLVLPKSDLIPSIVTAGGKTVALRWPAHPFVQALIERCGFPLAAPSANLSGGLSPTTAEHVQKMFGDKISLIIDAGPCRVGIESTVVDLTTSPPRLLRPGIIHQESMIAVTGELGLGFGDSEEVLKSPGLLERHYAPKTRLSILKWKNDEELQQMMQGKFDEKEVVILAHQVVPAPGNFKDVRVMPHDAEAFGRALYAELHRVDESGARLIVVEAVPDGAEWEGVRDRLQRAATTVL